MSKYKDWSSWWDGLRSAAMKAGALSISTQLTAFMGTNAVASLKIPGLTDVGESWKTAIAGVLIQFGFHTVQAAASYVANKPDPDIIETNSNPAAFIKPKDQ